jgi:hypothetical protein
MAKDSPNLKKQQVGRPADPTLDPQSLMGDTTGLSGITAQGPTPTQLPDVFGVDDDGDDLLSLSLQSNDVQDKLDSTPQVNSQSYQNRVPLSDLDEGSNDTLQESSPPSVVGEQSVSGDMPDPEADDNVLDNAHQMGIGLDAGENNPKPLNIAADVAAAEERRRGI